MLTAASSLATAGHPRYATEILDAARRVAEQLGDHDSEAEALERLARQAWANADTPRSLEYARKLLALPLAETSVWKIQGFLRLARSLSALGRPREALEVLREAAKVCDYTRFGSLATYVEVRAYTEHHLRMKTACLRDFQLATDMAEALEDHWARVFSLVNYGVAAAHLGEPGLAQEAHEEAITVSEQHLGGWPVTYARLSLAQSLLLRGEPYSVRDILIEVQADELEHPSVAMKYAWLSEIVGTVIPYKPRIRLDISDLLDAAFRSLEPSRIAPMTVAYHQQCLSVGKKDEAHAVLTRALSQLQSSQYSEFLNLTVIRFGTRDQLERLAELWIGTSEDEIGAAHYALIHSRLASLKGDSRTATALAGRAEAHFRKGGLAYFEAVAKELGGRIHEARKAYATLGVVRDVRRLRSTSPSPTAADLTKRQREVVRLALRGLGARDIALSLGISRRTAEHHLAVVMQTLGVVRRGDLREDPRLVHLSPRS